MRRYLVLMVVWLAGCIPAETPPQLDYTPGPSVAVTDNIYRSEAFIVLRPDGWRVITSAADAPTSVIFVAPGDNALIVVSVAQITDIPRPQVPPNTALNQAFATVTLPQHPIYVAATAPDTVWDNTQTAFDMVRGSVKSP